MIPSWLLRERDWEDEMMYMAHSSRMHNAGIGPELANFVYSLGFTPFNPFGWAKYEHSEGGRPGRQKTLKIDLAVQQRICGRGHTGILGMSEGVGGELEDRLSWDSEKRIRVFPQFDPNWVSEYEKVKKRYGDLLAELRGPHSLNVFVGARAIGKTYWIEKLKERFGRKLERVRNFTTRQPREEKDKKYYHIVTKDQFQFAKENFRFLESDEYGQENKEYYGSSLLEIRPVLNRAHGIFAMTPSGVRELDKCRLELNLKIVLLKPANNDVLRMNLVRRGILDVQKQDLLIEDAKKFVLPPEIEHETLVLTGTKVDEVRILNVLAPVLK